MGDGLQSMKNNKEYQEFMISEGVDPPASLSESVHSWVSAKLSPPLWIVLSKVVAIYSGAGLLVLLICPQFGVSLTTSIGLVRWFSLL